MDNVITDRDKLQEAAIRPIVHSGPRFRLIAIILGVFVAIGLGAYVYQFIYGLGVTGMNNDVFWGIYIISLVDVIGMAYGGAVVSAMLRLTGSSWRAPVTRLAEAVALVTLLIGALFPIIDLGHPTHIWRLFVSPNPGSPILWDIVAILTYTLATILFFYMPLIPDLAICRDTMGEKVGRWRKKFYSTLSLGWKGLPKQQKYLNWSTKIMSILIIPMAVSVHSVLAWVFAVTSRPGWHSTIFAPYFVIAALFSGVAAVILAVVAFRKAYHLENFITEKQIKYLSYIMIVLGIIYLYFAYSEYFTDGYTLETASVPVLSSLLYGNYAPLFWLFIVGGGVIPVLLVAFPRTRNAKGLAIAAALVVGGMWLKRFLIIIPALRVAVFPVATQTYSGSFVEWAILIGALAAIPLTLMLMFRVLPIISVHEMEEVKEKELESQSELVPLLGQAKGAGD